MAKSKKDKNTKVQKSEGPKTEKLAQRAGKLAAQAERIARDAVDKAVHASSMIVDVFGHPGQIGDAAGSALTAARKTAGELGEGAGDALAGLSHAVDDRVRATVKSLGLVTKEDFERLSRRIAALEASTAKPAPKAAATKAPAKKAAAAKAPAARKAPAKKATK
jgi:hypothetical protein